MTGQFECKPIGFVLSPFKEKGDAPSQGRENEQSSQIVIFPEYAKGLDGLSPGRQIFVICWFDRSDRNVIEVHPRGNPAAPLTGVFNTRSPARPNPVSLTLVIIESIKDNVITVCGLDALNETPVIDIKPYSRGIDESKQFLKTE